MKLPSHSHRSQQYSDWQENTEHNLRELLNVPANFHILFCSSATEIWERLVQNGSHSHTTHMVNGAFSYKFLEVAQQLGRDTYTLSSPEGEGFDLESAELPEETELLGFIWNESSCGVTQPLSSLQTIRTRYPNTLVAVDGVSIVPYGTPNYHLADAYYFSVQKGMGLPAGLSVWIVNERFVQRAEQLRSEGYSIGSYHSLPSLLEISAKHQTPATPNMMNIYLLGKVAEDMNRRGVETIRKETEHKAIVLQQAVEAHPQLDFLVKDKAFRSKTINVLEVADTAANEFLTYLQTKGLAVGSGYGAAKNKQVRIANFPAHSKEAYYALADAIADWRK